MDFSLTRLRAQVVKELLSILRDPRARAILVFPPLMQLFVFSFAATLEVRNAPVAVHDLSLIHISEPTRPFTLSRMPSSA